MTSAWKLDVKVYYEFCMVVSVSICIYLQLLFWTVLGGTGVWF